MKEKKNIDRIFQEKFKDFEREPAEPTWKNIASRLDKKEKKRPLVIPLWLKLGGVAALIALVVSSIVFNNAATDLFNEPEIVHEDPVKDEPENPALETNKTIIAEGDSIEKRESGTVRNQEGLEESSTSNNSSTNTQIANTQIPATKSGASEKSDASANSANNESGIAHEEGRSSNTINEKEKSAITPGVFNDETSGVVAKSNVIAPDSSSTLIPELKENALAELENEKKLQKEGEEETEIAEQSAKKMRLSTFAAPVFYKNIGSGNELSNQLSNNATSSEVTMSYGVKVAYQVSNKLKIRTGISKIDINNNTKDILYSPTAMSAGFENINPVEDNIEIRNNSNTPSPSGTGPASLPGFTEDGNNSLTTAIATPGELNQQFGYIEVPVELEFAVIDKKFGLNIIGGGSGLFLDNNRVDLISGENKTNLGEAANINKTSFSTNIGIGMDYKLTQKFSISIEPIFKYQLNTFNNVDNVQPVNFGVYSGLNFRF